MGTYHIERRYALCVAAVDAAVGAAAGSGMAVTGAAAAGQSVAADIINSKILL